MIQPAVPDIVRPAVPAEDPDALLHQVIGNSDQALRILRRNSVQAFLESFDSLSLLVNSCLIGLFRIQQLCYKRVPDLRSELTQQVFCDVCVLVDRQPVTETE